MGVGSDTLMSSGGTMMGGGEGICPSVVNVICPPHMQRFWHVRVRAGCPCTITCILPGIHGAVMAGMQGIGVSTPMAAEVAAATVGLAIEEHMPKGMMLTIGVKSMMLPRCMLLKKHVRDGLTMSDDGAIPKVQVIRAPVTTYEIGRAHV